MATAPSPPSAKKSGTTPSSCTEPPPLRFAVTTIALRASVFVREGLPIPTETGNLRLHLSAVMPKSAGHAYLLRHGFSRLNFSDPLADARAAALGR